MAVNYEDKRLQKVEESKNAALTEVEQAYGGAIEQTESIYQQLDQNVQNYADKQTQLQQEQTDFAVEQIEQQKDQTQKDYLKEQSAAYTDYKKQTAQHGVEAEAMAAQGMAGTGYSESSKVSMYNTYQNRVATARATMEEAIVSYNNAMTEAKLQNNSVLAEIAFNALQQSAEYALQGLLQKNQLLTEQLGMKLNVESMYHGQYMDILDQINTEKAQEEQIRQFDLSHQLDVEALAQEQNRWQAEYDLTVAQTARQEKLNAAQIMATAGDFSGYKDALGLTDDQVEKLEAKYQEEITSEAEAKDYSKKQAAAAILAESGDFSLYKQLYDLTDEQIKKLEEAYGSTAIVKPIDNLDDVKEIDNNSLTILGFNPNTLTDEQLSDLVDRGVLTYKIVNNIMVFGKGENYGKAGSSAGSTTFRPANRPAHINTRLVN